MFHGNHISVFFQFTSFRTTCLALNIIMYIRKKVLYTNICLFSRSPQPKFRIMQKGFLKEWNFGHIEDFLQNFVYEVPEVDSFLRNYLQKQPPECSVKKGVLKSFAQENLCVGLSFFNKVAGLWPASYLTRYSNTGVLLWSLRHF